MTNVKLWVVLTIVGATCMAVLVITIPLVLTRDGTNSPPNATTATTPVGTATITTALSQTTTATTSLTRTTTATVTTAVTATTSLARTTTAVTTSTATTPLVRTTTTTTVPMVNLSQCSFSPSKTYYRHVSASSNLRAMIKADLNNDNRNDIIILYITTSEIGVLLTTGGYGIYTTEWLYSTGDATAPSAVTTGDLNGDNLLDIIVIHGSINGSVGVFLNTGNGMFSGQTKYSFSSIGVPSSIAAADVNGDNQTDIIITNSVGRNIAALLNTGNGVFSNPTAYPIANTSNPSRVIAADVDGDNKLDIIFTDSSLGYVGILITMGNGTFREQITFLTGSVVNIIVATDVNGDNRIDIIIGQSTTPKVGIFFNSGNGSFTNQTTYSIGAGAQTISLDVGDVNGDNQPDIVVVIWGPYNIGVFFNTGNGTFTNQMTDTPRSGIQALRMVVVDMNGDGRLDIVYQHKNNSEIGMFFNAGNGTFTDKTMCWPPYRYSSYTAVAADINGDNQLDVIVANYGPDNVGVLFNTGNATFTGKTLYSTGCGSSPHSVAAADVNGDRKIDIIVANYGTDNIGVLLNTNNGILIPQTEYFTGSASGPYTVVAADLNGDDRMDIVVANYLTNNVGVLLNTGNGIFARITLYSTAFGSSSISVTTADVNSDNRLDILVANPGSNTVGVLLNTGNGTFSRQMTFSTGSGSSPWSLTAIDINSDNKPDIIVANLGTENIGVLFNTGNGMFSTQTTYYSGRNSKPSSVTAADVNGDGRLDAVVANNGTNTVLVFLNSGNGTLAGPTPYSVVMVRTTGPLSAVAADFDGDNKLDILVTNPGTDNVGLLLSSMNSRYAAQIFYELGIGSAATNLVASDINGDEKPDIIASTIYSHNVVVFLNMGNGFFGEPINYFTGNGSRPTSLAAADVNGDNKIDIIVAISGANNIGIFFNTGNGTFSTQILYQTGTGSNPTSIAAADVNGDNKIDIIVANSGAHNIVIFFNTGNGSFTAQTTYPTGNGSAPDFVATVDVNGDNKLDIIVSNPGARNIGIFFNTGNGSFTNQTTYSAGNRSSTPNSIAVADLNGDNQTDIVVTYYTSLLNINMFGIFFNTGNGSFANQTFYSAGFRAFSSTLATADVNGDNKIDIIVGNSGLSSTGDFFNMGILFNIGNGMFTNRTTFYEGRSSGYMTTADLNGDKKVDIIVTDGDAGNTMNNVGIFFAC